MQPIGRMQPVTCLMAQEFQHVATQGLLAEDMLKENSETVG